MIENVLPLPSVKTVEDLGLVAQLHRALDF